MAIRNGNTNYHGVTSVEISETINEGNASWRKIILIGNDSSERELTVFADEKEISVKVKGGVK